jgi:hypothetical protein
VNKDAENDDAAISDVQSSHHIPGDRHQHTGGKIADSGTKSCGVGDREGGSIFRRREKGRKSRTEPLTGCTKCRPVRGRVRQSLRDKLHKPRYKAYIYVATASLSNM